MISDSTLACPGALLGSSTLIRAFLSPEIVVRPTKVIFGEGSPGCSWFFIGGDPLKSLLSALPKFGLPNVVRAVWLLTNKMAVAAIIKDDVLIVSIRNTAS